MAKQYIYILIESTEHMSRIKSAYMNYNDAYEEKIRLLKTRSSSTLTKEEWMKLQSKLENFLDDYINEDDGSESFYEKSDAFLIYKYITKEYPIEVLEEAQDLYELEDEIYDIEIKKIEFFK